jgi:hypothetical protein
VCDPAHPLSQYRSLDNGHQSQPQGFRCASRDLSEGWRARGGGILGALELCKSARFHCPLPLQVPGAYEDPVLYVDPRGNWHIIWHVYTTSPVPPTCVNSTVSGHWYSPDGLTWYASATSPFPNTIPITDGTTTLVSTRERPKILFNAAGDPAHLYNGVCGACVPRMLRISVLVELRCCAVACSAQHRFVACHCSDPLLCTYALCELQVQWQDVHECSTPQHPWMS